MFMYIIGYVIFILMLGLSTFLYDGSMKDPTVKENKKTQNFLAYMGILLSVAFFMFWVFFTSQKSITTHDFDLNEWNYSVDSTVVISNHNNVVDTTSTYKLVLTKIQK